MQERFVVLRDEFQTDSDDAHYDLNEVREQDLGGPDPVWNLIADSNVLQWEVLAASAR